MEIGAIVIVESPVHIATVIGDGKVACENGTILPIDSSMQVIRTALEMVQAFEEGILTYGRTWRLCDRK